MDENFFNIVESYAKGKAPTLEDNSNALFYPCTVIREKCGLGGYHFFTVAIPLNTQVANYIFSRYIT